MKKIALLLCAVLTAGALTACSGGADATTAVSQTAAQEAADKDGAGKDAADTPAAGAEEKSDEAGENSADTATENPFSGKTVKVGCSATFVPFESIEMAADGSKTYVGMNIDIVKAVVEKNGGQVEFVDMPFKSLMAAIQPARLISAAAVWRLRQRGRKHWISAKSFSIPEMPLCTGQRITTRIWIL